MLLDSKVTISVIAATLLLVVGGIWLILRKIGKRIAPGDETEVQTRSCRSSLAGHSEAPEHQNARPAEEPPITSSKGAAPVVERLTAVAIRITDSDLREFMGDLITRVGEEGPDFSEEASLGFIEEMVDRMDDLRTILKNHQGESAKDVERFRQTLTEILSACGVELIHSAEWDPSVQRAIAKEPTPEIHTPTILRFGTTGIRRFGQLLRKQEVILGIPQ